MGRPMTCGKMTIVTPSHQVLSLPMFTHHSSMLAADKARLTPGKSPATNGA